MGPCNILRNNYLHDKLFSILWASDFNSYLFNFNATNWVSSTFEGQGYFKIQNGYVWMNWHGHTHVITSELTLKAKHNTEKQNRNREREREYALHFSLDQHKAEKLQTIEILKQQVLNKTENLNALTTRSMAKWLRRNIFYCLLNSVIFSW